MPIARSTWRHTRKQVRQLRDEFRTNCQNAEAYLTRLEQHVEDLFDFARYGGPDWDWRMNQVRAPQVETSVYDAVQNSDVLPLAVLGKLGAFYCELLSLPPDATGWADEWNGDEVTFYAFLRGKVRTFCAGLRAHMSNIREAFASLKRAQA